MAFRRTDADRRLPVDRMRMTSRVKSEEKFQRAFTSHFIASPGDAAQSVCRTSVQTEELIHEDRSKSRRGLHRCLERSRR